jgi:hypothetical protein
MYLGFFALRTTVDHLGHSFLVIGPFVLSEEMLWLAISANMAEHSNQSKVPHIVKSANEQDISL